MLLRFAGYLTSVSFILKVEREAEDTTEEGRVAPAAQLVHEVMDPLENSLVRLRFKFEHRQAVLFLVLCPGELARAQLDCPFTGLHLWLNYG